MGVAMMVNKKTLFVMFVDRDKNDSKHIQASFSLIPTHWLRLLVAQIPRFRDLAIFVVINRRTNGQTDQLLYPCVCVQGNYPIARTDMAMMANKNGLFVMLVIPCHSTY